MGISSTEDPKKIAVLRSQIENVSIEDLASTEFPSVTPEETISDAIAKMRRSGFQEIPVTDKDNYVGMIGYGKILKKKNIPMDTKVKNLIWNLPTVTKDTATTKVAEMMTSENCRQLALVNGKKVVGLISRRSLMELAAKNRNLKDIKVGEIMTYPVESLTETSMMNDAIDLMRDLDIRTVPVIDNEGRIKGIVGMSEIIDNFWKDEPKTLGDIQKNAKSQILVESVCRTDVKTVTWESYLDKVADIMVDNGISTIPVTQDDELIGIITEYDIIQLIASLGPKEKTIINYSGIEDDDKHYVASMVADAELAIDKMSKLGMPEILNIHVARYNEAGDRKKYSLTGKMFIEGRGYDAKEVGWDIVKANADLMKKFTEMVLEKKDKTVSLRKRKARN